MPQNGELAGSLEALSVELERVGCCRPVPPSSTVAVDELEVAIAPLRLPRLVNQFWRTVDPRTIGIQHLPAFMDAGEALDLWRTHVTESPDMIPRVLLPLGYESHAHLSVELDGPETTDGGALFLWHYTGAGFDLAFNNLVEYLDELTLILRHGAFTRLPRGLVTDLEWYDNQRFISPSQWLAAGSAGLSGELPYPVHPVLGPLGEIPNNIEEWPETWQTRSNLGPETRAPLGADRTIADVLLDAQFGSVSARIHARVIELAGSNQGCHVTVEDETGTMRIWCPKTQGSYSPGLHGTFEFSITLPPVGEPEAPDFESALRTPAYESLPFSVDAVIQRLTAAHRPVDATATNVVPIRDT